MKVKLTKNKEHFQLTGNYNELHMQEMKWFLTLERGELENLASQIEVALYGGEVWPLAPASPEMQNLRRVKK